MSTVVYYVLPAGLLRSVIFDPRFQPGLSPVALEDLAVKHRDECGCSDRLAVPKSVAMTADQLMPRVQRQPVRGGGVVRPRLPRVRQ